MQIDNFTEQQKEHVNLKALHGAHKFTQLYTFHLQLQYIHSFIWDKEG